jgi:hypothetical protein
MSEINKVSPSLIAECEAVIADNLSASTVKLCTGFKACEFEHALRETLCDDFAVAFLDFDSHGFPFQLFRREECAAAACGLAVGGFSPSQSGESVPTQYALRRIANLTADTGAKLTDAHGTVERAFSGPAIVTRTDFEGTGRKGAKQKMGVEAGTARRRPP